MPQGRDGYDNVTATTAVAAVGSPCGSGRFVGMIFRKLRSIYHGTGRKETDKSWDPAGNLWKLMKHESNIPTGNFSNFFR
jgi:hypothetical protein